MSEIRKKQRIVESGNDYKIGGAGVTNNTILLKPNTASTNHFCHRHCIIHRLALPGCNRSSGIDFQSELVLSNFDPHRNAPKTSLHS